MFCYQCSETMKGTGCTVRGVCGKEPEAASLQDLLIWLLKGVSFWGNGARKLGVRSEEVDLFVAEGLFTTITNVNFDPLSLGKKIEHTLKIRDRAEALFRKAFADKNGKDYTGTVPEAASWKLAGGIDVY